MKHEESIKLRLKLLDNYEKRINFLRQRLSGHQGRPDASADETQQLKEQISYLQERKNRLEDHYREIDDMREEAAELREAAQEFRLVIASQDEQRNL